MKRLPLFASVWCALLIASSTLTAQTVSTDPVGFTTLPLKQGLNLLGLNLVPPVEFQGVGNVGGDDTTITVTNGATALASLDTSAEHFVEITGGAYAGLNTDVTGISGSDITLADPLPGDIGPDFTIKVHKHWTLASVFGATSDDIVIKKGASADADRIWLLDPATGQFSKYYFESNFVLGDLGWREVGGDGTDQSDQVMYYTDGFVLERKGDTDSAGFKLLGAVNTDGTTVALESGLNIVGNFYPGTGTTLAETFGASDAELKISSGTAADADLIWIIDPDTGSFSRYFYEVNFVLGELGWREVGGDGSDQADTVIPEGASIVVEVTNPTAVAFDPPFTLD